LIRKKGGVHQFVQCELSMSTFSIVVSFTLHGTGLLGYPHEFNPRLAIQTTDPSQRMTVASGKSFDWLTLKEITGGVAGDPQRPLTYQSERPVVFSPIAVTAHPERGDVDSDERDQGKTKRHFPINDPMADLCVALYVSTRTTELDPSEKRDNTMAVGQCYIPWHLLLRGLVSDGHAWLVRSEKGAASEDATVTLSSFPSTNARQEFSSLLVRDGIDYKVAMLASNPKTRSLALELKASTQDASRKASVSLHIGLVKTGPPSARVEKKPDTYRRRLRWIEKFLIANYPGQEKFQKPSGIDRFVFAMQRYDAATSERDRIYRDAMAHYQRVYESFWASAAPPATTTAIQSQASVLSSATATGETKEDGEAGSGPPLRVLVLPAVGGRPGEDKFVCFRPDVPSMARFHLPTWVNGDERYPFVMFWRGSLPGPGYSAPHLPEATAFTEAWLRHMLGLALRRARISPKKFVLAVSAVTHKAWQTPLTALREASTKGSKRYNRLLRCLEAGSFFECMVAHNCRYSPDVRLAGAKYFFAHRGRRDEARHRSMYTLDVEHPSHDAACGTADDNDCEDMEWLISLIKAVTIHGQRGAGPGGERGWSNDELHAMQQWLSMLVLYANFGSVQGAQLKDSQGNKEEIEGFIGSSADLGNEIGGHMASFVETKVRLELKYEKHKELVYRITGKDRAAILRAHTSAKIRIWLTPEDKLSPEERARVSREYAERHSLVRHVFAAAPPYVNEGTGRQEPLLLYPEDYFGQSQELLVRAATHASEVDVLRMWPKRPSKGDEGGGDEEKSKTSSAAAPVASLGEALPYSFQRRLLSESHWYTDASTHQRFERHLSAFYRRLGHSFSGDLHAIDPEWDHLIWVSATRMTYGPTLRDFLETMDALPIPLPRALAETYEGNMALADVMHQRMRRIISYDLSFKQIKVSAAAIPPLGVPSASMSDPTSLGELAIAAALKCTMPDAPFFARSECNWTSASVDDESKSGNVSIRSERDSVPEQQQTLRRFTVYVPTSGPVARVLKTVFAGKGRSTSWQGITKGRLSVRYEGPEQVERIRALLAAGEGIYAIEIVHERILPHMADLLCVYFKRRVRFEVDDDQIARMERANKQKKQQQRRPGLMQIATIRVKSHFALHSTTHALAQQGHVGSTATPTLTDTANGGGDDDKGKRQFTLRDAEVAARHLRVDTSVVPLERLRRGMNVELEHGRKTGISQLNVTQDQRVMTAAIALAHLLENPGLPGKIPDYYEQLDKMEAEADKQWAALGQPKPSVFLTTRPSSPSPLSRDHEDDEEEDCPSTLFSSSPSISILSVFDSHSFL
jgi:hypothetical protein